MKEHEKCMFSRPPGQQIGIAIPLTQGKYALIDKKDAYLAEKPWNINTKGGYAQRTIDEKGKKKNIFLHRVIAQSLLGRPLTRNDFIKHINGNTLDNRRENLECVSISERNQGISQRKNNTSGYVGLTYDKKRNKWASYISIHRQKKFLGRYNTPEEAALAYNEAARTYYGENARLNNIPTENNPSVQY